MLCRVHAIAQKEQGIVDKAVERLRSETLRVDGKGSEAYKNSLKINATFDKSYKGVGVIDGDTGELTLGPKFLRPWASEEMSVNATKLFNALSTPDRQLFILRHELEHMSGHNVGLVKHYSSSGVDLNALPR